MAKNSCNPHAGQRYQNPGRAANKRLTIHRQQQLVGSAHAARLTGCKKYDSDLSHQPSG
jgi:hypothetical protein